MTTICPVIWLMEALPWEILNKIKPCDLRRRVCTQWITDLKLEPYGSQI